MANATLMDNNNNDSGDCGGEECEWWQAVLGVLISSCASSASAFANVLMRWSHVNNESLPESQQRPVKKRCHVYFIMQLYILNGLLDMAAYSLAPMSLLAPTSGLTIIINALVARAILGEVMTRIDVIGSSIIFVGAVTCTIFGSKESEQRSAQELKDLYGRSAFVAFAIIYGSILALCMVAALVIFPRRLGVNGLCHKMKATTSQTSLEDDAEAQTAEAQEVELTDDEKKVAQLKQKKLREAEARRVHAAQPISYGLFGLAFATMTAGVASWTNIFLKSTIEMVVTSFDGDNQLDEGVFWLIAGALATSACLQVVLTAKLFEPFETIFIVPMFQSVLIISLIVTGGMYFNEFARSSNVDMALFGTGCAVCLAGILVVASQDKEDLVAAAAAAAAAELGTPADAATADNAANLTPPQPPPDTPERPAVTEVPETPERPTERP